MEDNAIRAIVIGVSLFVTMLTLTAIIIYFNTARSAADIVSKRQDIASSFDSIMYSDNFETTLTGVQVRSLINKYVLDDLVKINIIDRDGRILYEDVNHSWAIVINDEMNQNNAIISEEKLSIINPSWKNTVEKVENSNQITLNINLNV